MNSPTPEGMTRREVLQTLGAAAVVGLAGSAGAAEPRPQGREYLIRGGQVVSVDGTIGDLPRGDVHLRDGVIVAVGPSIAAPRATVVDATNCVVMPGFVETHWHMWSSIWRGMATFCRNKRKEVCSPKC